MKLKLHEKEGLQKQISEVNRLRIKLWDSYRKLRNDFISKFPAHEYNSDPDWVEINFTIIDMYESTIKEDMRRNFYHGDSLKDPSKKFTFPPIRKTQDGKPLGRKKSGLYTNEKLCQVCRKALRGRQEKYCSTRCSGIMRSRRFKEENYNYPTYIKAMVRHFLKSATPEEKKEYTQMLEKEVQPQ